MSELAGNADGFAAEVTGVKNGIHALMAANQQGFAQAAALPGEARATFVQQVAAMVDEMKATAAARISASTPPQGPVRLAQNPQQQLNPVPPPEGTDPQAVAVWWHNMGDAGRAYWNARPEGIAGLDGIPTDVHNTANRTLLDREIAELEKLQPTVFGPPRAQRLADLIALRQSLDAVPPGEPGQRLLLGFDNEGDGQAIVAVGNPDTARHVATLIPGLDNDISSVPDQIKRADSLRVAPDSSTIVWLDYNAPEALDSPSLTGLTQGRASDAAGDFARFQDSLRVTHMGEPSFNTVVGHSYGATVAGLAAASDEGLNADRFVLVAPTDPVVNTVNSYHLNGADGARLSVEDVRQRVWATAAPDDQVVQAGNYESGHFLFDYRFGARLYETPAGSVNPHTVAPWEGQSLDRLRILVGGGLP
jgi:pimeloyl-ACP methyl ester carboxylesterase